MHSCLKGEVEMYLEQAITRINNIDWDRVGTKSSVEDGNLGKEFLRRLANAYISVYEPLIEIFECGGSFNLRKNDLDIENVIFIPLNNWFDKFKAE